MEKKKILITGYPFTGTSILKSKFGECSNLYEIKNERFEILSEHIQESGDKEFILLKTPVLPLEIRVHGVSFIRENNSKSVFKDYYVIFITRNPWNLFSSIIKAGWNPLSGITNHLQQEYFFTIREYLVSLERFKEARDGNFKGIYAIRYEDLFAEANRNIKKIMNDIGLKFDENVFETKTKEYYFNTRINPLHIKEKPETYELDVMRTWQINQPFKNMNTSEIEIPEELNKILSESPIIKELGYTDPRIK